MANVTDASLQPIYERLHAAPTYHPLEADTFADWSMEAGDIVTITRDGTSYASPVHSSTMVWKKGQQITLTSTGNEKREAVAKVSKRKYRSGGSGLRNSGKMYNYEVNQDHLMYEVWDTEGRFSQLEVNAMGMYHEVYGTDGSFAVLANTANGLYHEVMDSDGRVGTLAATARGLYYEVYDPDGTVSQLKVDNEGFETRISKVVDSSGTIKSASIMTSINHSGSHVILEADHIDINGIVERLETYDIRAEGFMGEYVNVGTPDNAGEFSVSDDTELHTAHSETTFGDLIVNAEIDSSTGELVLYKGDGTTINFSKAASITDLEGNWSGSSDNPVLVVTTLPSTGKDYRIGFGTPHVLNPDDETLFFATNGTPTTTSGNNKHLDVPIRLATLKGAVPPVYPTRYTGTIEVNAEPVWNDGRNNGKASVGLNDPVWNAITGEVPDNRTVSVTTSGRTNASGVADNITKSMPIYLTQGEWSSNTLVVSMRASSTEGTQVAKTTVDASGLVTNATRAGKASVGLGDPAWNAITGDITYTRTISVTTTGRTNTSGVADNITKSMPIYLTQGEWSSNKLVVSMRASSTTGTAVAKTEVDASNLVTSATRAGKASVGLDDPVWNAITGEITDTRTVSMTTTGRTNTSGVADNITKSMPIYLVQGSWSGNNLTVFMRASSTSGTSVAKTVVDATSVVEAATATARYAGKASVGLGDPSWNAITGDVTDNRTLSVTTTGRTDTSGTAANITKSMPIYLTQGTWSSNKLIVSMRASSTTGTEVAKTEVDASGLVTNATRAGKASVGLDDPVWNAITGEIGETRTISVTTTGRTNTSGTADNITKSMPIYLTQGEWSSNKLIVSMRASSTSGTQVAKTEVDATSIVNAAATAATYAGKASVGLGDPAWNAITGDVSDNRTLSVTTTGRTNSSGTADNITKSMPIYLTQGEWSSNKLIVSMRASSTSGTQVAKTEVDASNLVTNATRAGKASVGLGDPAWNAITGDITNTRTLSVTTTGRTNTSGTADNITKSMPIYLTQGTWSSNKLVVSMRASSTTGTAVAKTEVDATSIVNAATTAATYAGKASVTLNDPAWNAITGAVTTTRTLSVTTSGRTNSSGTADNLTKSMPIHLTQGTWSDNKLVVSMRASSTTGTEVAKTEVDATSIVNAASTAATYAGKASVTLNDPTWNSISGSVTDNRTISVTTSGRTNSSGSSDNLTKSMVIYLTQDGWSSNKMVISMRASSTTGTQVAKTEVNAGTLVTNATYAGKASVTLNDPAWNSITGDVTNTRTISVTTSGRTNSSGTADNLTKSMAIYLTQGSWSSNQLVVSMRASSTTGTQVAKSVVDGTSIYNNGWGDAYRSVDGEYPTTEDLTTDLLQVPKPHWTPGNEHVNVNYYITSDNNDAYIRYNSRTGTKVATVNHNKYNAGRAAVTLNDPVWNAITGDVTTTRTLSVTTSGRTNTSGVADNITKSMALHLTQGSWSNNSLVVSLRASSTSGTQVAKSVVDGTSIYNNGWGDAYRSVDGQYPTEENLTTDLLQVPKPHWTPGNEHIDVNYYITSDNNDAYIRYNSRSGTKVATINHGKYNAGRAAVTLNDPVWNSITTVTDTRTISVTTSGRTNASGVADNLTKSMVIYLTQGTWSSNKLVVSMRASSTTGTQVAKTEVDASTLVTNATYAGKAAVTLNDPVWNSVSSVSDTRTISVTTSGRTDSSGTAANLTKSMAIYLTQGSWSSNKLIVSMRASSTTGTQVAKTEVDASSIYSGVTAGTPVCVEYPDSSNAYPANQADASDSSTISRTIKTTASNGNTAQGTLKYRRTTYTNASSQSRRCVNISFRDVSIGRLDIQPVYDAGWTAGAGKVSFPATAATTGVQGITVYGPSATTVGSSISRSYSLSSLDDDTVQLTTGSVIVAYCNHGKYTAGRNSVVINQSDGVTCTNPNPDVAGSGTGYDNATGAVVYRSLKVKASNGAERDYSNAIAFGAATFTPSGATTSHRCINLSFRATRVARIDVQYIYNTGWQYAQGKVALPATITSGTSTFSFSYPPETVGTSTSAAETVTYTLQNNETNAWVQDSSGNKKAMIANYWNHNLRMTVSRSSQSSTGFYTYTLTFESQLNNVIPVGNRLIAWHT